MTAWCGVGAADRRRIAGVGGRATGIALAALFGILGAAIPGAASAQEPVAPVEAAQPAAPGPAQVQAAIRALADSAQVAEREIARLSDLAPLHATLDEALLRHRELVAMMDALGAVEHIRPERISRLRDRLLVEEQRFEEIATRVDDRLTALGTLQVDWLEARGRWVEWRGAAADRPALEPLLAQIDSSIVTVNQIVERIQESISPLGALGDDVRRNAAANRALVERIAELRAGRREALMRPQEPMLFSTTHLASLRDPEAWRPGDAVRPAAIVAFARDHAGLLLLHLLAIVALATIARRVRPHTAPEGGWSGLLFHPWAFGFFAATALLTRRYAFAPPLWDVVTWSLLAGSGAVLAATLLRGRALRLMIVSIAAVYPLILLGEALLVPAPVFRLVLAGAGAAAVIGFPLLARHVDPTQVRGRRVRFVLWLATALSAAVLIAQVLGFDLLARWLVHAMITSAYVIFTVAFLIVLARGALRTLLRREYVGRVRLVGAVGVPLVERLVTLLQIALVVIAVLVLLDVWEVAPSPAQTWRQIVGWGFEIAGLQITISRIIVAVILVYLAVTASWFVRSVVSVEVSRSWGVERGVADSINALVHYAVITLGVLLGLGALGVELQNFAIVAGALGVGIGFGLQNVVNNFVSGIILLFERPVRAGDTVEIDGEWGTIKKIGLRSTVVVTFTQSELIVPNADLVSSKVTNWTLSNPMTRLAIPVGVAYGSDVQRVLQVLIEAGSVHPAVMDDPAPSALFIGFGDSSLDFELRIWIRDIASRLLARSDVLAEIDRRFREEGIEIPFPQRDLHLRSLDPAVADRIHTGNGPAAETATPAAEGVRGPADG